MSGAKSIEFAGNDDSLEEYLLEFARLVGGWAARQRGRRGPSPSPGPSWIVAAGSFLSTNPNTLAWRVLLTREEGRLALRSTGATLPWTRSKVHRIVDSRIEHLADYLEARERGKGPESFGELHHREPFSNFGADPAALTAAFAWSVACGLGAMALALAASTIASYPLMSLTIGEIVQRAGVLERAGAIPLPSPGEIASIGFWFKLGSALLFAFPLAFFAGLVHSGALIAGEIAPRAARLPQASFLFQTVLFSVAFWPFLPIVSVPLALLVPLGAHLGYTLVWSLRRERLREGPRPRRAVVAAGVLLAGAAAFLFVPAPAAGDAFTDRLALFRDRFMLGNPPGKAAARFYYTHTLYTAEPLKEFFSLDDSRPARPQRIATAAGSSAGVKTLKSLHFTVVREERASDVRLASQGFLRGDTLVQVRDDSDRDQVMRALDQLSRDTFRGHALREVSWVAWRAVYHGGPPIVLLVLIGACSAGVSILYRRLSRRGATLTLLGGLVAMGGLALWSEARLGPSFEALRSLRSKGDAQAIGRALADAGFAARHEAAYRAFKLDRGHADLVEPLLKAADDPDLRVRLWACAALGKTGNPRALPKLLERLADPELFVRYRAAEGLGFLKRAEAVEPLVRMTREGTWYEGSYALEALRKIEPGRF